MRYAALAAIPLFLFCLAVGATPQQHEPGAGKVVRRLSAAVSEPLADPSTGRLYRPAAQLLEAARHLPDELVLRVPGTPEPPAPAEAAPAPVVMPRPEEPGWQPLVDAPVVEVERFAHALYLAGDYEAAVQHYRRLHEAATDNCHFLTMLFLSTRNAGRSEEATALQEELLKRDETRDWAEWLAAMVKISRSPAPPEEPAE